MEQLGTFDQAHEKILADVQRFMKTVQQLSSLQYVTAEAGIAILDQLRKETYEDLNQIQHEHLIIRAAEWLCANNKCAPNTVWSWNPRQTGDNTEPDLRGTFFGSVTISAEITTSEKPNGTIAKRMQDTLTKLSVMDGMRYYFVRTDAMRQRASTKVAKSGWEIEIVQLRV